MIRNKIFEICYYGSVSLKTAVWIGVLVGSSIGGYIPILFGASFLSLWSLLGNTVGALLGIFLAYKLTQ